MKRREFFAILGGAAINWSSAAAAQQLSKTYHIGVLERQSRMVGGPPLVQGAPPECPWKKEAPRLADFCLVCRSQSVRASRRIDPGVFRFAKFVWSIKQIFR